MAKPTKKTKENATDLPDSLEQERILKSLRIFVDSPRFYKAKQAMLALKSSPPQSLLLEGGSVAERSLAALYWSTLLNCTSNNAPCLECPVCVRFASRMHRDLFFFDGSTGNIKIEDVREMRSVLGEPPRESQCRVVIFAEGQSLGEAAANGLLKSLEEPQPGTLFVLTAPQRERLLQTLVSRSWVLTLPWPGSAGFIQQNTKDSALLHQALDAPSSQEKNSTNLHGVIENDKSNILLLEEWIQALLKFAAGNTASHNTVNTPNASPAWMTGRSSSPSQGKGAGKGWMERTARRGSLDSALAMQIVLACQASLLEAISGNITPESMCTNTAKTFSLLAPSSLHILSEALAECQDSLNNTVNPALVMDWLATRLFFIFAGDAKRWK